MKVLVQDAASGFFLAADGRWVDPGQARNFFSILPAYHWAQRNTCAQFHVALYFPEDGHLAVMITGKGSAAPSTPLSDVLQSAAQQLRLSSHPLPQPVISIQARLRLGSNRNHLN